MPHPAAVAHAVQLTRPVPGVAHGEEDEGAARRGRVGRRLHRVLVRGEAAVHFKPRLQVLAKQPLCQVAACVGQRGRRGRGRVERWTCALVPLQQAGAAAPSRPHSSAHAPVCRSPMMTTRRMEAHWGSRSGKVVVHGSAAPQLAAAASAATARAATPSCTSTTPTHRTAYPHDPQEAAPGPRAGRGRRDGAVFDPNTRLATPPPPPASGLGRSMPQLSQTTVPREALACRRCASRGDCRRAGGCGWVAAGAVNSPRRPPSDARRAGERDEACEGVCGAQRGERRREIDSYECGAAEAADPPVPTPVMPFTLV